MYSFKTWKYSNHSKVILGRSINWY